MTDLLPQLLTYLHLPGLTMTGLELAQFDSQQVAFALEHGLLRKSGIAHEVVCPACEESHIAEVLLGDGSPRIACPSAFGLPINPEWFQIYAVEPHDFARAVRSSLGLKGDFKPDAGNRFWQLGREPTGERRRCVFISGLGRGGTHEILSRVCQEGSVVAFTPIRVSLPTLTVPVPPILVGLNEVMRLTAAGLEPRSEELALRIRDSEEYAARVSGMRLHHGDLQAMVSRQVARTRSRDIDPATAASAVRIAGSYRAAEKWFADRGIKVNFQKIRRLALEHGDISGEPTTLNVFDDGVSFQVRNTPKKFRGKRKHQN